MANRKYKNAVQERKARTRINNAYKKRAQTAFTLRFHNVNDSKIINRLKEQENTTNYIRGLVTADMEKEEI
jgi:hypothetical protein